MTARGLEKPIQLITLELWCPATRSPHTFAGITHWSVVRIAFARLYVGTEITPRDDTWVRIALTLTSRLERSSPKGGA
ncbi:hypothetical protein LSCM4_07453 [Leishmania orientalis]|uniref:Uncharacterized protein n=1 Tax=Leishmania orientalis TaxID=2249476 RepID=A0A836KYM8_9TRYP|nr:hypothetical protein LSCM4_07453 [Leishmania orientalis]